ncbi:MAG: hypothetical protein SAJ37_21170 [Oscillatoria sp. PMC 1068.18]|nr:hypothetical protein [Oscillatoria sp. PMC 1076.18]MEC4991254.1 hypothetical protein [Oscillatoria sp. PMC 1068.18]
MSQSISKRLEAYTIKCPQEVLIIRAEVAGDEDEIAIFKGFSSSLMRPTAFDPDVPVLPDTATILRVDRAKSPFNPKIPDYIQKGLSWSQMESLLAKVGV